MTILVDLTIDQLVDQYDRWLYVGEANDLLTAITGRHYTGHPVKDSDVASPVYNAILRGNLISRRNGRWIVIDPESLKDYLRQFKARKGNANV